MSYNELRKERLSTIEQDYFVTFTTANKNQNFLDFQAENKLTGIILYHQSIEVLAWVIMPDHVHILFTLKSGSFADSIKLFKGKSSREIPKADKIFTWAKTYYEHALRKEEDRIAIARYVIANPLRAMLVRTLMDYPWWNAKYF